MNILFASSQDILSQKPACLSRDKRRRAVGASDIHDVWGVTPSGWVSRDLVSGKLVARHTESLGAGRGVTCWKSRLLGQKQGVVLSIGSNISHSFEPIKLLNPYLYMYVTRRQISKERESPDFLPGNVGTECPVRVKHTSPGSSLLGGLFVPGCSPIRSGHYLGTSTNQAKVYLLGGLFVPGCSPIRSGYYLGTSTNQAKVYLLGGLFVPGCSPIRSGYYLGTSTNQAKVHPKPILIFIHKGLEK
ncbi:hypothetical protein RRG08_058677 [Elysia crispata]|uniref:Uncharacterized protein n=1 Tax=Elysia crispata TaxID=231223 RepID=A0AAE0YWM2_9GAST|nr:hypothetical protein RRG08_058677 [Elysia crispata]